MATLPGLAGVHVGHHTRSERPTGCTVILTPAGAVGAVDVRGAAPGTRETDLLDPANTVTEVHGIVLSGGSAYGLSAADGVMAWLAEHGHGLAVGPALVPIVPAAVLFDLLIGDWRVHPDSSNGYSAAEAAMRDPDQPPAMGSVGVGAGATVGKLADPLAAMRGGIGHAVLKYGSTTLAAIVACNAVGDVRDPSTATLVAGARRSGESLELLGTSAALRAGGPIGLRLGASPAEGTGHTPSQMPDKSLGHPSGTATTIGVVITDARLTKAQAKRLATCAHDGIARAVDPAHTTMDGDTMFALATCADQEPVDLVALCALAAQATADAILAGTRAASGLHLGPVWLPAASDLPTGQG